MGINDLRRTPKTPRPRSQYSYMHTRGSRQALGLDAHPGTLHHYPDITKKEKEERAAAKAAAAAAAKRRKEEEEAEKKAEQAEKLARRTKEILDAKLKSPEHAKKVAKLTAKKMAQGGTRRRHRKHRSTRRR